MKKLPDEIHPGEILPEEFMNPMGIAARRLDELLGGISGKNLHKPVDTGEPACKEVW